jgi:spermidine synthase
MARQATLYLAFFLSGAAALAYESVWTRYLGLLVGHDAYAQVLVLVIFLGGMSGGAALIARHTTRIRHPLVGYALIEAIVGVLALGFHGVFQFTSTFAYDTVFPALADSPLLGTVKWGMAALLILPQSILLGTTFPLMSAGIIRLWPSQPGRILSWLYFTNSLGGAVGVLLAGFVLVDLAGLPGTLAAAGALNLLVALLAFVVGRASAAPVLAVEPAPAVVTPTADGGSLSPRLLLGLTFGTAVASFAYEIDWIRMLSLVLGSATHSFELMLSAFILGLAIGALAISRLDRLRAPLRTLGYVQVAMGVLAILTLPVYVASFEWMASLLQMFNRTDAGYTGFSIVRYALCLAVMLPATICAGMTLPLTTRALMLRGEGEAAIGKVYTWNTLGSIVGVSLAALVLLPGLGLKPMLLLAGALDVALGLVVFTVLGSTRRAAVAGLAATVIIGAVALMVPLEQRLITSGVYRRGTVMRDFAFQMPFYADGRTATVAVGEGSSGSRWISTNGKPDASLGQWWRNTCSDTTTRESLSGDDVTQILLPLVTQSYRPDAKRAAIIGFGSGMSSHILLAQAGLEELTTIEIEPEMVAGSRIFLPANARVYDDPRSRIVMRDAKAHFATAGTRWDLILSEPSNPWVSGVSGLFTEEFYRRVASALAPGGVFGQWLHTYELNDRLVLSVLSAIDRVFPAWQLHQVGGGDLLVIATIDSTLPPFRAEPLLASAELQADLCRFVPISAADIAATRIADRELLAPVLAAIGQANSDYFPVLDLGAERERFRRASAAGMMSLGYDWFNLAHALDDTRMTISIAGALPFRDLAMVRESWVRTLVDSTSHSDDGSVVEGRRRARTWSALATSAQQPADWRSWLDAHAAALLVRHAGMAGVVDSAFVLEAERAAIRLNAPVEVRHVLAFRHAVQGWNDAEALTSAMELRQSGALISADELRDGAVVMALRADDRQLAQDWFGYLRDSSERPADDLRSLLLETRVATEAQNLPD